MKIQKVNSIFNVFKKNIFQESKLNKEVELLLNGNRAALSRTITLIESSLENDKNKADKIMKELVFRTPNFNDKSFRIGICGAPGSGKSTLIEKVGLNLIN